jgi:serum/glucocorticoid-regulated kinase 2
MESRSLETDVSTTALNELRLLQHGLQSHENVQTLLEVHPTLGTPTYESLVGISLEAITFHLQGPYASRVDMARRFGLDVANGLVHLHEHGVVHRNLVPESVLVVQNVGAKIGNFDSCAIGVEERVHTLVGTPEYMAPEMLKATAATSRVDWWSFGCLLYEIITGASLFDSQRDASVPGLLQRILYYDITTALAYNSNVRTSELDMLSTLLTRDPAWRAHGSAVVDAPWFSCTASYMPYQPHQPLC